MNYIIPSYIEKRIRKVPPDNSCIVTGSTPVVVFGNLKNSRVATIGINPSKNEFSTNSTNSTNPRLETLSSLGLERLEDINDYQVRQIWESCNNYFHRDPYHWFNKLQKILTHLGVFYDKDTACHLDLVQWATAPVWGKIQDSEIKSSLIKDDRDFLKNEIKTEDFEILLLNGRTVINEFQETFNYYLDKSIELKEPKQKEGELTCKICYGYPDLYNRIKVIGLSRNLQSYRGLTNTFIETIARRVSKL